MIASPIDYDHGCAPIGWRDYWRQSATLGYDHGHRNRDHGGHPLSRRLRHHDDDSMRKSFWRCCRLDIVVTTSLQCSRQPSSVVWVLGRRQRRRWQTTRTTSVVGRPTLSSFVIVEIRHIVWGHAITMSICPGVCVSDHSLSQRPAMAIHVWRLSQQFCFVCRGVPVPAWMFRPPVTSSLSHGSGSNVIKEIEIQTFCDW